MPYNKRQHFVPRFYMKYFSVQSRGKVIGVYNIESSRYIAEGDLKGQAYRDYFYGKEDQAFDDALKSLETNAAPIITSIIQTSLLPNKNHPDYLVLLAFVILLSARTANAADLVNDMIDKAFKKVFSKDPRVKDSLEDIQLQIKDAVLLSLQTAARAIPITFDLTAKLLVNKTPYAFLTSDHPVVFYNLYLESIYTHKSNTGLATKGIEIFLPLSPRHYLVIFDHNVYKFGNRKELVIEITDEADTHQLNQLQLLNARQNIYFDHTGDEAYISKLAARAKLIRERLKSTVQEYRSLVDPTSSIIQISQRDVRCNLKLSFASIIKKARQYNLDGPLGDLRSLQVQQTINELQELYKYGPYKSPSTPGMYALVKD